MKVKVKMMLEKGGRVEQVISANKIEQNATQTSESETKDMKVKENVNESESEDDVREGRAC